LHTLKFVSEGQCADHRPTRHRQESRSQGPGLPSHAAGFRGSLGRSRQRTGPLRTLQSARTAAGY
jgi:hypothetical protein